MPPQQLPQRNEIVDWYNSIPPITKALFTLTIATTTISGLGLIQPSTLILYWPNVKHKLQLWRLVTCFFFNKFSIGFAFNTYFLYRNSLQLENEVFSGQPADYMFFHLFTTGLQLAAASIFGIYVLSDGLLLSVAYLWAQHHQEQMVSFMFGVQFKAMYLPWVMIASDFLMSGGVLPRASIAGLVSSHVYHYLTHIYPNQGGRRYLQTPNFLKRLFPSARGIRSGGFRAGFSGNDASRGQTTGFMSGHRWGPGRRLNS
ncbi:Der1-like family-domain-containing protein [Gilbertella persicaria]|uniref:Der1-like family-domain-containing protein n=1 Tax=Gilbertella persicaria TaxID=101096 RepID=UPI00221ED187|nr:Der1-like family-domain-containing protein [Gilbertella persicaria]XP_051434092.1 Der1-like family-domain-containing protein [Gilbertella persicaria]KAI8047022.1 Der1-like family-domain-containing protein [Gilbertella persicaria]KAI8076694.1 Der1-like family-domain-containing protein [Gilbertella persicaria]